MKKLRKIHLWIGLVTSMLLLVEAITGLILEEPGWFGMKGERPAFNRNNIQTEPFIGNPSDGAAVNNGSQNNGTDSGTTGRSGDGNWLNGRENMGQGVFPGRREGGSFRSFVEQLHRGVINGVDVHWLMDAAAIAIILLTSTGIYLSIRLLLAERRKRAVLKRRSAFQAADGKN